jgi:hypothetical protein
MQPKTNSVLQVVLQQITKLAEQAKAAGLERLLFASATQITQDFLRHFLEEARRLESELGTARAWHLIEAHNDLIALTSGDKKQQVAAALRLSRKMIKPKIKKNLRAAAAAAAKSPEEFLQDILFPEGLILASAEMETPQRVRLGRKWVVRDDGTIQHIRPVRDLSVGDFIAWLYQEATRACNAILQERAYPGRDLVERTHAADIGELDLATVDRGVRRIKQSRYDDQTIVVAIVTPSVSNPLDDMLVGIESADESKKQVSALLSCASRREAAIIEEALRLNDGDMVELLATKGMRADAIRQIRRRLRRKM